MTAMQEEHLEEPKVSIIIINFNGTDNLVKLIDSILKSDYNNYEIIVVDCLTKELNDTIGKRFPGSGKIKVVHFDRDIGAAASHNVGAIISDPKSKYLVFMDDDIIVTRDWLRNLVKYMEKSSKIGVVQAKLLSMRDPSKMDHLGLALDMLGTWFTAYGEDASKFNNPLQIFAASSATMITRRDVYFEVGGFDSSYFIYDDDTDYSWRVRLRGYAILYSPEAVVYHKGGLIGGLKPDRLYYGYRNRLTNLIKNLEIENMVIHFPLTLLFGFLNILFLAIAGRYRETSAYVLATLNVLKRLPKLIRKRYLIQLTRKVGDDYFFKRGLIRRNITATVLMSRRLLIEYYKYVFRKKA